MATAKITVTLDAMLLEQLDELVAKKVFPNRSSAVQQAVREKIDRINKMRLARECAKLNPEFEQAMAEDVHDRISEFEE